jgi:hypothetical protein
VGEECLPGRRAASESDESPAAASRVGTKTLTRTEESHGGV